MKVRRYAADQRAAWDGFVDGSKNGTFLLKRGYMDYHANRFEDCSLVISDPKGRMVALFPANRCEGTVASHSGLTYGGMIVDEAMTTDRMMECFTALLHELRGWGVRRLEYKTIPSIYHRIPAEEDRYALFVHGAALSRRDVLSVIAGEHRLPFQERRMRGVRKALARGLVVEESRAFAEYWPFLELNLRAAHDVRPVHSLTEIELLAGRFPANVRLHLCRDRGRLAAGVVVYDTGRVAHVQYISSDADGKAAGALDLLFSRLIEETYRDRAFFDFGISNEEEGRRLNVGLVQQKEGFGARAVVHDYYRLELE
jgi:hypothetical protein